MNGVTTWVGGVGLHSNGWGELVNWVMSWVGELVNWVIKAG